ncbi:MAG: DUF692 domain-containing protein [Gammaproteobacteria bacterium]|nr:DUF692 domain-containing protein [Gammaproteobacteria bacterium]
MSTHDHDAGAGTIPDRAGIGLRAAHYQDFLRIAPEVGWVEVHSENYFGAGGPPHVFLERIRERYPLSLHGVALSLGSADPLEGHHARNIRTLIERYEPGLVSDHLCWSSVDGVYFNDLLPLPYTEEALAHVAVRIDKVQAWLKRKILVENPSSYLRFSHSTIPEWEFLAEIARRTGCGLLLDVNNVHVSAHNLGFDALAYIDSIPAAFVEEIHLAGFAVQRYRGEELLIDTHGALVAQPVWELFDHASARLAPVPVLIEWDTGLPSLEILVAEALEADRRMERTSALAA